MKKQVLCLLGALLISSNLSAKNNSKANFNKLHGVEKINQKVDQFASWNGIYSLVEGSKRCHETLDIAYLKSGSSMNYLYINSSAGQQSYTDYIMENIDANQFRKFEKNGESFQSTRVMYGLRDIDNKNVVYTYNIKEFSNNKIDMNINFGKNDYILKMDQLGEDKIQLLIDDNASIMNRIKGIVDWERIRSRNCTYQKLDRDFSKSNRFHE